MHISARLARIYGVDPGGVGDVALVTSVISMKIFGSGSTLLSVSSEDSSSDVSVSVDVSLSSSSSSSSFLSSVSTICTVGGSGEKI